jgi:NAD-dependent deacetylase
VLKPDATLFGEPINPSVLSQSLEAARNCDLLLVVGTSAHVAPASGE